MQDVTWRACWLRGQNFTVSIFSTISSRCPGSACVAHSRSLIGESCTPSFSSGTCDTYFTVCWWVFTSHVHLSWSLLYTLQDESTSVCKRLSFYSYGWQSWVDSAKSVLTYKRNLVSVRMLFPLCLLRICVLQASCNNRINADFKIQN